MANTLKIKRGTAATIPQGQLAEPLFTTDTYDLYIGKGSGGNQRIQNYIASGTSSQFLKGDGTLDSTSYQPLITAGTTLQYYRGDKTFQTLDTSVVPENGPIYFTEPRVRATVLTGLNLSGGGTIAATDSILTAFGKVQNQISAFVGGATYQGTWNASTNTPTLASGTGTKGYYYVVSVAGSTNLDGITDWKVGDWAIFNGTTWDKVDNTDAVSSVNGFTGAVNLALDNISDVSAASPTNAQLLRFNGTSSLWENWTPTFEPALTKGNLTSGDTSYLTVSGGTGAVIGSGTTISILASGIVNGGLTLTTTGNSGAATKTFATLNIPEYTLAGLGGLPLTGGTLTGGLSGTTASFSSTIQSGGDYRFAFGFPTIKWDSGSLSFYSTGGALYPLTLASNGEVIIGESGSSSPLVGVIRGSDGVGTNIAGAELRLITGRGTGNAVGGDFVVQISPAGTSGSTGNAASPVFELGNSKVRFNRLTTNGFLKTSSANGTVTVDTTSYLPLTGGTITGNLVVNGNIALIATTGFPTVGFLHRATDNILYAKMPSGGFAFSDSLNNINLSISSSGALSGTSATFTLANDITLTARSGAAGSYTYWSLGRTSSELELGVAAAANQFFTGTAAGDVIIKANGSSNKLMLGYGSGNPTLTLASTGAATFSSSVTAKSSISVSNNGAESPLLSVVSAFADGYRATVQLNNTHTGGKNWLLFSTNNSDGVFGGGKFALYNNTDNVTPLIISSTGAATFSSSVTAINAVLSGTGSTFGDGLRINRNSNTNQYTVINHVGGATNIISVDQSGNNIPEIYFQRSINGTSVSDSMMINKDGKVGIGTTSPNRLLEVATSGDTYLRVTGNRGNADDLHVGNVEFYNSNTTRIIAEVRAITGTGGTQSNSGQLAFYTNNAGTYAERMRITSGGDITTGGLTAGYLSAANRGNVTIYGSTDSIMSLRSGASGAGYFYHTGTHLEIYNTNSGYIKFATENAEVLRLTKEAWLYIQNRTAAPAANPVTGGYLYCESGALKYRGSSGTVTTIANA